MAISFNQIPIDIRTPGQYIEFDNSRAVQGSPAKPHKALIIAQGLAAGSVAEAVPTLIPSGDLAEAYWGAGSHMAEMARAFKVANPSTELWGVSLDDAGGATAATKTVTLGGAATEDGVINLYIGGRRVQLAVTNGDAAAAVSTALDAAIVADNEYDRMPFTSAEAASVVTLTARNGGLVTDGVDVRANYRQGEFLPAGLTLVVADGVSGAVDPDLTTAIAALGATQYDTIAMSFNDDANIEELAAELELRWGPMSQLEGHAFVGAIGTQAELIVIGNGLNQKLVTVFEIGGVAGNSPSPFYVAAATVAAVDAFQTQVDPARPRQTLILPGILPPAEADQFDQTERNILLTDGIATHFVDPGGSVRIERLITTYQTNPLAIPDPSYLDITTLRTLALLRFEVRARIGLKYPQHKLANDGTLFDPGQAVVTPSTIRSELIGLFREWEGRGLVEGFDQFKADLLVERDSGDVNRVNARLSPDLINQFRVFAGQIQFLL